MNMKLSFQTLRSFPTSYSKWHFLPLVVTYYSAVCYTFTHCPCASLFTKALFSFPEPHSIRMHFTIYLFFLQNNFCFRSQEHLRSKRGWSQKLDYFPSFLLLYHPQNTRKHRTCLHLSFLFINFRFCQYNKSMIFMFIFYSVFSI